MLNNELCLYRRITGVPDGGCGTFRALKSLANFDIISSLNYNPLTLPTLIFITIMPFMNCSQRLKFFVFLSSLYVVLTVLRLVLYLNGMFFPFILPGGI